MWTYVARRLLYALPILAGVMFLTFIIFFAISSPKDLARVELGQGASEDRIAEWTLARGFASYSEEGRAKLERLPEMEQLSEKVAAADEVVRGIKRKRSEFDIEIKATTAEMPAYARADYKPEPKPAEAVPDGVAPDGVIPDNDEGRRPEGEVPEDDATEEIVEDTVDGEEPAQQVGPEGPYKALYAKLDQLPESVEATKQATQLAALEAELKEIPEKLKVEGISEEAKKVLTDRRKELTEIGGPDSKAISRVKVVVGEAQLAAANARLALLHSGEDLGLPPDDLALIIKLAELQAADAEHARDLAKGEVLVEELKDQLKKLAINAADIIPHGAPRLFVTYIRDLVTFNFGENNQRRPVTEVIGNGMWPSIKLMVPAFLLTEFLAVALALFAALYRGTKIDRALVVGAVFLMSFSSIAIVMIIQKLAAADWGYFPISGYRPGIASYAFLALPMILYVIISVGPQLRFNRILMLDEIGQDYVRTAKAKGLGQNSILFKHVLRNAMIPLITRWAVVIPNLYLGSLILESFFGIPGLGGITVQAIANRDVNMIRALVFIGTLIYIASTLLADVLYAVVDPRVKLK